MTAVGRDPEPQTEEEAVALAERVQHELWLARQAYIKAHPEVAAPGEDPA